MEVPSRLGYSGISGSSDSLPVAVTAGKDGLCNPSNRLLPALSPGTTILTTHRMQPFYSVVRSYSRLLVVAGPVPHFSFRRQVVILAVLLLGGLD